MAGNKKVLNLSVKNRKTFNIFLDVFESVATLLFNIRSTIVTDFIMSLYIALFTSIKVKKVKLIISKVNLIANQIQILNLKKIKIVNLLRETDKVSTNIPIRVFLSFVSRLALKVVSTINTKKISMTFTAILATFYTLGQYDIVTLGTMDTSTLGDLDYVLS